MKTTHSTPLEHYPIRLDTDSVSPYVLNLSDMSIVTVLSSLTNSKT